MILPSVYCGVNHFLFPCLPEKRSSKRPRLTPWRVCVVSDSMFGGIAEWDHTSIHVLPGTDVRVASQQTLGFDQVAPFLLFV